MYFYSCAVTGWTWFTWSTWSSGRNWDWASRAKGQCLSHPLLSTSSPGLWLHVQVLNTPLSNMLLYTINLWKHIQRWLQAYWSPRFSHLLSYNYLQNVFFFTTELTGLPLSVTIKCIIVQNLDSSHGRMITMSFCSFIHRVIWDFRADLVLLAQQELENQDHLWVYNDPIPNTSFCLFQDVTRAVLSINAYLLSTNDMLAHV